VVTTTAQPEVIVLTGCPRRARQIRLVLQPQKVGTRQVATLDECRGSIDPSRPQLLVLDSVTTDLNWQQVCDVARTAGVPLIAIVERFDSRRWVELFKAGVLDVMSDPIPAPRLQIAVHDVFFGAGNRAIAMRNRPRRFLSGFRGWLGL